MTWSKKDGTTNGGKPKWNSLTIDRVNGDGEYEEGNIRMVLFCVNSLKGSMTDEQIYAVVSAILDRRKP